MNRPRINRSLDPILAALFVLVIWFPSIYTVCGFHKSGTINEYRTLEKFPGLASGTATLQIYGKEVEKYYDDHFGGRELLISCRLNISHLLFPDTAKGAIVGREGWLYSLGENMLDNFLGTSQLTLLELKSRQRELEERRDQLAARGIKYLFVITPNKESVYPEYLPDWLRKCANPNQTDQFLEYMHLHSTVQILDLRPILLKVSERTPVFYKTDTHWNLMGAFAGCEAIIEKLSDQCPELAQLSLTNFAIGRTNGTGGDIARYAGMLNLADDNLYDFTPKPPLQPPQCESSIGQIALLRFGTLPVPECPVITTTDSDRPDRAILFGDSYTFALAPFIGSHFGEATILRKNFSMEDVDKIKPTVVIDEKVERFMHSGL